ncbi:hypothetical protein P0W64_17180 [Tsukamurella sp. 8F]|uniref:hypothetical protein n=1 Tax=unclassified Tsukamurella TaxID=2633480 RepID=UPI0023BA2A66|nr:MULTISPECIES: hypothetical protein [unclassified Tsukamurella]MDF0531249.1 hypothetical protein [Tsukamurella sp. 8J]MDF0588518.1 hypothetical protein [Tsukamurella sp. 8F]
MEMDPAAWERTARQLDALADSVIGPRSVPRAGDRYERAIQGQLAASDRAAAEAAAAVEAVLRELADSVAECAARAVAADAAGAVSITGAQ